MKKWLRQPPHPVAGAFNGVAEKKKEHVKSTGMGFVDAERDEILSASTPADTDISMLAQRDDSSVSLPSLIPCSLSSTSSQVEDDPPPLDEACNEQPSFSAPEKRKQTFELKINNEDGSEVVNAEKMVAPSTKRQKMDQVVPAICNKTGDTGAREKKMNISSQQGQEKKEEIEKNQIGYERREEEKSTSEKTDGRNGDGYLSQPVARERKTRRKNSNPAKGRITGMLEQLVYHEKESKRENEEAEVLKRNEQPVTLQAGNKSASGRQSDSSAPEDCTRRTRGKGKRLTTERKTSSAPANNISGMFPRESQSGFVVSPMKRKLRGGEDGDDMGRDGREVDMISRSTQCRNGRSSEAEESSWGFQDTGGEGESIGRRLRKRVRKSVSTGIHPKPNCFIICHYLPFIKLLEDNILIEWPLIFLSASRCSLFASLFKKILRI